jgi:hypothetical protein
VLALISFATGYVSTNMKLETMTDLAKVLLTKGMTFNKFAIPAAGTYKNFVDENGTKTDQLDFDLKQAAKDLNALLYGDSFTPTPAPAK